MTFRSFVFLAATFVACPALAQFSDHGEIHSSSDLSSTAALSALMQKPVVGQPYAGQKVTRAVWTLGDGTVITREADTLIARDGEGRVREELETVRSSSIGAKQDDQTAESITIADPVDHSLLMITPKAKLAMRMMMPDLSSVRPHSKMIDMLGSSAPPAPPMPGDKVLPPPAPIPRGAVRLGTTDPGAAMRRGVPVKDSANTRMEDLGKQSIAGVLVTGKRTTTVIPLGKIGNDRPITVVHEEWYSPDLQLVVKSMDSDPREGVRTMEIQGMSRAEPDAALFKAPEGYTVRDMGDMMKTLGGLGRSKTDAGATK